MPEFYEYTGIREPTEDPDETAETDDEFYESCEKLGIKVPAKIDR